MSSSKTTNHAALPPGRLLLFCSMKTGSRFPGYLLLLPLSRTVEVDTFLLTSCLPKKRSFFVLILSESDSRCVISAQSAPIGGLGGRINTIGYKVLNIGTVYSTQSYHINPERSAAVIGCRSRYELLFTSLSCAADLQVLPSEIVMAGGVVGIAFPL